MTRCTLHPLGVFIHRATPSDAYEPAAERAWFGPLALPSDSIEHVERAVRPSRPTGLVLIHDPKSQMVRKEGCPGLIFTCSHGEE